MGDALEAGPERFRYHLWRPVPGRRDLLTQPPETPLVGQARPKSDVIFDHRHKAELSALSGRMPMHLTGILTRDLEAWLLSHRVVAAWHRCAGVPGR